MAIKVELARCPRDNDQLEQYLCRADIPDPWKTRDPLIDEMLGLQHTKMHPTNLDVVGQWTFLNIGDDIPMTRRPDKLCNVRISRLMYYGIAYIFSEIIVAMRFQVLTLNTLVQIGCHFIDTDPKLIQRKYIAWADHG